jgi:MSHA biogenesis protein MshO
MQSPVNFSAVREAHHSSRLQRGFTMVELVMVIVLMGIVGGMVVSFMKPPIDAYFAVIRRAALTDQADTVARRISRDIRTALPNSMRTPSSQCLEFIPTKTGGRYRAGDLTANDGTALDFSDPPDSAFNILGSNNSLAADQRIAVNDLIAIYNLGITGSDAYNNSDNTSSVTAIGAETGAPLETPLTITPKKFPLESPGRRFHVIPAAEKVVAYVCSGGNLYRTASSVFYAESSANVCPTSGAVLARKVSACNFDYSGSDVQRNALVTLVLQFTDSAETVSLHQDVHVSNTP